MSAPVNKTDKLNNVAKELLLYTFILLLLVLTSANVTNYLEPEKVQVLGAETQNSDKVFWNDFMIKNPDYIPGWIELGRFDKVREIDPNYQLTQ